MRFSPKFITRFSPVRLFDERGAHPPYGLVTLVKDLLAGPAEDDGDVGVTRQRNGSLELLRFGYLADEVELQHGHRDICLAEPSNGGLLAGESSRRRFHKVPLEPRAPRKPVV